MGLSQNITGDKIRWLKGFLFVGLFAMIIFLFSLVEFFVLHFSKSIFAFPGLMTRFAFHLCFSKCDAISKKIGPCVSTIIKDENTPYRTLARLIRLISGCVGTKSQSDSLSLTN